MKYRKKATILLAAFIILSFVCMAIANGIQTDGGFMSCWWRNALCMAGGIVLIMLIEYIPFFAGIGPGADLLRATEARRGRRNVPGLLRERGTSPPGKTQKKYKLRRAGQPNERPFFPLHSRLL